jgi:hypothetical protein
MKRKIACFTPGIVARIVINASTANYDVIRCASLNDMPNYRHDKIANLMRSEVGMLSRMSERKEALARCIKPYICQEKKK